MTPTGIVIVIDPEHEESILTPNLIRQFTSKSGYLAFDQAFEKMAKVARTPPVFSPSSLGGGSCKTVRWSAVIADSHRLWVGDAIQCATDAHPVEANPLFIQSDT